MHNTSTLSCPILRSTIPCDSKVLPPRLSFDVKITDIDHFYELKCRLCADGSRMTEGIVFENSYAPNADADARGRRTLIGTDWCNSGKATSGQHILIEEGNQICFISSEVIISTNTSLTLSGANAGRSIISGNGTSRHFNIFGNLTLIDLILEHGMGINGGSFIFLDHPPSLDNLISNILDV